MSIPTQPSNRRVIDRMIAWGWTAKTAGEVMKMTWPPTGETIQVRAATQHKANTSATLKQVGQITCGGLEKFWNDTPPQSPVEVFEKLEPSVRVIIVPDKNDEPAPRKKRRGAASPNRGLSKLVLDLLVEANNRPLSIADVAKQMGVTISAAAGSLAYLVEKGHAVRVLAGQYVASPGRLPDQTVRHEVTGGTVNVDSFTVSAESAPATLAATAAAPAPAALAAPAPTAAALAALAPASGTTTDPAPAPAAPAPAAPAPAAPAPCDSAADVDAVMALWMPERVRFADMQRIAEMRQSMIEFISWVNRP